MIWPPPTNSLEGAIVRLEPIAPADHDGLLAASRAPEAWTWIDRRVPDRDAAFGDWFEARLQGSRGGSEWCFVTHSVAEGRPVGSSSYLTPRPEHNGLEIGWTWLHPAAWRTGANVEAKLLMLGFAFDDLGCMRVEFKTDARNERSRAALLALPATFEGIFHKHMLVPVAGVRDSAYYSITDEDWPAARANLTARLTKHSAAAARA